MWLRKLDSHQVVNDEPVLPDGRVPRAVGRGLHQLGLRDGLLPAAHHAHHGDREAEAHVEEDQVGQEAEDHEDEAGRTEELGYEKARG